MSLTLAVILSTIGLFGAWISLCIKSEKLQKTIMWICGMISVIGSFGLFIQ